MKSATSLVVIEQKMLPANYPLQQLYSIGTIILLSIRTCGRNLHAFKLKLDPCTNMGVFVQVYLTGLLFT